MSDCDHYSKSIPYVFFEGPNGYFRTGRHVDYDAGATGKAKIQGATVGVGHPHTKLLVSICHAMGLSDVEKFGDEKLNQEYGHGPLPNLRA